MKPLYTLGVLVAAAPLALAAQDTDHGAFVLQLGHDTVAVERFARSGDRLEGRCVVRTPRTVVRNYSVALAPDGTAQRVEVRIEGGGSPPETTALEFTGDRAGAIPFLSSCWGLLELATRRFSAGDGAPLRQPAVTPGTTPQTRTITVERRAADSLTVTVIEGLPYRVAVDRVGRIHGAAWPGDWSVVRLASLDIESLAAAFGRRPLGPLSPADSVRASIGGATVAVNYSRPSTRGRVIFGNVVPWDEVWRTGANEATLFTTSADLDFGDAVVPAGRYTLWTIPRQSGWTLILNRNTGQWGTDYNAQYDLVRLEMRAERLAQPVDQFTIALEPRGAGGVLRLDWASTRAWIAFRPRPASGN